MPDRQRLSRPAEDDLLVRDEARQPHRVDRRPRPGAPAVAFAVPDGASRFVSAWSSTISAFGISLPARPRTASSGPRRARSSARGRARSRARPASSPSAQVDAGGADDARHAGLEARAHVAVDGVRAREVDRRVGAAGARPACDPLPRAPAQHEPTLPSPRTARLSRGLRPTARVEAPERRTEARLARADPGRRESVGPQEVAASSATSSAGPRRSAP